jgi:hypothetical protein
MSPLSTHRRARRQSRARRLVFLGCAVVVLALVIGGVTQVGRQSGPFYTSVNRSFSTQAAAIVQQSNATGTSLRHLMATMQNQAPQTLQANLDTLTTQADQQAADAEALTSPASPGDVQGQFVAVFSQRARAVQNFRSAVDGLLGLHPLPTAGTADSSATAVATPAKLATTQVTNRIAAAGTVLVAADRDYRVLRRSLARMAGHARLPSSRWVTDATTWQAGSVAAQLQVVQASPSLQAVPRLVLRVVNVTPPALPPASGVTTPALSVISPTTKVVLQVVISNLGSVDEPHASVQFTLTPQPSGAAVTVTRTAAVAIAGSVSLAPASFKVKPGTSYQLTVGVVLPAGQTDTTGASLSQVLQIAPGT